MSVEPWTAKGVELAIDFYGSRQRPPHGVLSESHLNSLAIALFLAMAESFNEQLGFLLLDDVINSFDVEHRGRLAELLADGFADWQLIVLTHDQQFFEHLSRRAPSWRKLEFTSWSYASGPRTTQYETSGHAPAAARERLESGDVQGAATKARRALEELLQEVCEALWAPLPFRRGQANDKREIGELFKGVRRTLKERAKPMLESVEPLFKNLEADVGATLNVAVHGSRGRSAASEVEAALERIDDARRDVVLLRVQDARLAPRHARRRRAASAARARSRRSPPALTGSGLSTTDRQTTGSLPRSRASSAAAAWETCTSPRTRSSIDASRSSFLVRTSRHRSIVSRASSGKPEPRPPSIIPTSFTSTRWRKPTA